MYINIDPVCFMFGSVPETWPQCVDCCTASTSVLSVGGLIAVVYQKLCEEQRAGSAYDLPSELNFMLLMPWPPGFNCSGFSLIERLGAMSAIGN